MFIIIVTHDCICIYANWGEANLDGEHYLYLRLYPIYRVAYTPQLVQGFSNSHILDYKFISWKINESPLSWGPNTTQVTAFGDLSSKKVNNVK